ncbi:MAG TPA: thioredoxin family protein [Chitinophagales bacterium]
MNTNKNTFQRFKVKAIGAIAVVATTIISLSSFKTDEASKGLNVGDKAVAFSLKNVDGKTVSLSDYTKGAIVVFTCNHCPFAKKYEDRINALNKKYEKLGYPVVAINPNATTVEDDNFENMQKRAKEKHFTFPYLNDETQAIALAYGATKTPHVFVLEKSGSDFVVKYIGAIDDNTDDEKAVKEKYVENAVNSLLSGKAVSTVSTKAIGCTIKWKN